jgi:hypothetical protein
MASVSRHAILVVTVGAALCLVLSPAVQAGAPDKVPPFTVHIPEAPMASCAPYGYSFDILVESWFYNDMKIFKDRSGDPIRVEWYAKTDDVFTNSVSRKSVVGHANFRQTDDVATNESTFKGLFWHTTIPGVGNVLQDAGYQVVSWNPFEVKVMKGTYQANVGDFEELCAALE